MYVHSMLGTAFIIICVHYNKGLDGSWDQSIRSEQNHNPEGITTLKEDLNPITAVYITDV